MSVGGRPCVFFDRDGVINRSPGTGYVTSWESFELLPGAVDVLRAVRDAGWAAVLVTSQRGVAKGLMSRDDLEQIHVRLQRALEREGVPFLDILACTYTEADRHWAKPNPDMILEAVQRHGLDRARSIMVGDQDRDIQMGINAGVGATIRVRSEKPVGIQADYECASLEELRELLGKLLR